MKNKPWNILLLTTNLAIDIFTKDFQSKIKSSFIKKFHKTAAQISPISLLPLGKKKG